MELNFVHSIIDGFYWEYVRWRCGDIVNPRKFDTDNARDWVFFLFSPFYFDASRKKMLQDASKFELLTRGKLTDSSPRVSEYEIHIHQNYISAIRLFTLNEYYASLDSCRKILELLIRRDLNRHLDKKLEKNWKIIVQWDDVDKKDVENLYDELCKSVHGQYFEVWRKSSEYAQNKKETSEVVGKTMAAIFQSTDKKTMGRFFLNLHGVHGLERYALEKIRSTIFIINRIYSKYQLGKPSNQLPQNSKPKSP